MADVTASASTEATTIQTVLTGLTTLGQKLSAAGAAIEAAAKANFADVSLDLIAGADAAQTVTLGLEDIGVPGAAMAMTVEQLIAALAPEADPAIQFIVSAYKIVAALDLPLQFRPAIPGASPQDGGYPGVPTSARTTGLPTLSNDD